MCKTNKRSVKTGQHMPYGKIIKKKEKGITDKNMPSRQKAIIFMYMMIFRRI
jgi:hypothetical protein